MTVNGTDSLCVNSVDSSLAKMVGPSESGSFVSAASGIHSKTLAGSESRFSLGKSMAVAGLDSDSGNLVLAGSRPLVSFSGRSDGVRAWEKEKRKRRATRKKTSLAIL